MISFEQARKKICQVRIKRKTGWVSLEQALGLSLAKSLRSPESLPSFSNSAMDGWAVRREELLGAREGSPFRLQIQGEIPAGETRKVWLQPGACLRIFTGAPIPEGADAVVIQEKVHTDGAGALFFETPLAGENIRWAGEDLKKGTLLLKKGKRLQAGSLALLAQLGLTKVPVFLPPRVSLITTGSELIPPEKTPKRGQIRDSVSFLIRLLLKQEGLKCDFLGIVPDRLPALRRAVQKGLRSEILILTGGVSTGDYDLVKQVLKEEKIQEIFWKVDMKPGKPIFFGRRKDTFVFGLPGNPLSSLVGYEFFVKPLLARLRAGDSFQESFQRVRLGESVTLKGPRKTHDLNAQFSRNGALSVHPLHPQGSHRIGQLRRTEGWAIVSRRKKRWKRGEKVLCREMVP